MPQDAKMFSDLNQHRQHHKDGNQQMIDGIKNNLELPNSNDTIKNFQALIYLSQINQAMTLKTGTEHFRRNKNYINKTNSNGNCMGTMYWQLNDVWQAPTWSSIEFSGKWKLSHYYIKNSYSDIIISPLFNETHLLIYAVSDGYFKKIDNFTLKIYSFDSFNEKWNQNYYFSLDPFDSKEVVSLSTQTILDKSNCTIDKCFILIESIDNLLNNFIFFNNKINKSLLIKTNIRVGKIIQNDSDLFIIELISDSISLFVYLDMNTTLFYGKFSMNGFHMVESNILVLYKVYGKNLIQSSQIEKYLTVTSLADIY
jgi:beta-mannosidase